MLTCSVFNSKGGSGKTTLSVNLYAYLLNASKKALLIDLDPQKSSTEVLNLWSNAQILNTLPKSKPDVDFVIIDYPPGLQELPKTKNVILPVLPGILDVKAARQTINALTKEQNVYIVVNCFDGRRIDDRELLSRLRESFKNVFVVHNRSIYRRSISSGSSVFDPGLKKQGGLSQAKNEIGYLANKIFNV